MNAGVQNPQDKCSVKSCLRLFGGLDCLSGEWCCPLKAGSVLASWAHYCENPMRSLLHIAMCVELIHIAMCITPVEAEWEILWRLTGVLWVRHLARQWDAHEPDVHSRAL